MRFLSVFLISGLVAEVLGAPHPKWAGYSIRRYTRGDDEERVVEAKLLHSSERLVPSERNAAFFSRPKRHHGEDDLEEERPVYSASPKAALKYGYAPLSQYPPQYLAYPQYGYDPNYHPQPQYYLAYPPPPPPPRPYRRGPQTKYKRPQKVEEEEEEDADEEEDAIDDGRPVTAAEFDRQESVRLLTRLLKKPSAGEQRRPTEGARKKVDQQAKGAPRKKPQSSGGQKRPQGQGQKKQAQRVKGVGGAQGNKYPKKEGGGGQFPEIVAHPNAFQQEALDEDTESRAIEFTPQGHELPFAQGLLLGQRSPQEQSEQGPPQEQGTPQEQSEAGETESPGDGLIDPAHPNAFQQQALDEESESRTVEGHIPVGTVVANAKAELGVSAANALSKMGGNVIANAVNGSLAKANAIANKGGNAKANTKTYGSLAASNSKAVGGGSAASVSQAIGGGDSKSNSLALGGGNAFSGSKADGAGNAISLSRADGGHAKSDSSSQNGSSLSTAIVGPSGISLDFNAEWAKEWGGPPMVR